MKSNIKNNVLALAILQFFNYIFPLLVFPFLVKKLGSQRFGVVMHAQSVMLFFNVLVDYGFNLSATSIISKNRNNKNKISEVFFSVIILKLLFLCLSLIVLIIFIMMVPKFREFSFIYLMSFGIVLGNALFPVWIFQGMERMKFITIINVGNKIISTCLLFIVVKKQSDFILVPVINSLAYILGGIVSFSIAIFTFKIAFTQIKLKTYFFNGFYIFISQLTSYFLYYFPSVIIGAFFDFKIVGYYVGFEKMISGLKSIINVINQGAFPALSYKFENNRNEYERIWKNYFLLNLIMGVVIVFIVELFSKSMITILYSNEFLEFDYIFRIIAFTILTAAIINMLGLQTLLVAGEKKALVISQIVPAVFFISLSLVLLNRNLLLIFCYAYLFSDFLVIAIRLYFIKKKKILSFY